MRRVLLNVVLGGLVVVGLAGPGPAGAAPGSKAGAACPPVDIALDDTKAVMRFILGSVSELIPLELDEARFKDEASEVRARLCNVEHAAGVLVAHANERDQSFGFLSRSLLSDIGSIRRVYDRGRHSEARSRLRMLTHTCVACHSRLPAGPSSGFAKALLQHVNENDVAPAERARLQAATRRFEEAMTTYESMFSDRSVSPVELDVEGHLTDYLTLALRVRSELTRAGGALDTLVVRPDVPDYLVSYLSEWKKALIEISARKDLADSLESARSLAKQGEELRGHDGSRAGVVYDIAASSILYRMVDSATAASAELSEALYLLASTDAWTRRNVWLDESRFYLEAAIRMAPKAAHAKAAFRLYEEYTLFGYCGSDGLDLPDDESEKISELRGLVTD